MSVKIELVRSWTDDHIPCCEVEVDDDRIELCWCGYEVIGAASYADESSRALNTLIQAVKDDVEMNLEDSWGNDPVDIEERNRVEVKKRVLAKLEAMRDE